jgi:hypothetical protein
MTHVSPGGLPFLGPEVSLLLKSRQHRPKDEQDFRDVVGLLSDEQRRWLSRWISPPGGPDHPWLPALHGRS